MAVTATQQREFIKVGIGLYGAALGSTYLNLFAQVSEAGFSIGQIYNALMADPFSQQANLYPLYLTNEQFAARLVSFATGGTLTGDAKSQAEALVLGKLNAAPAGQAITVTRGEAAKYFVDLLDAAVDTDPVFGTVAKLFDNRVTVAQYYSVDKGLSSSSLTTLQTVVSGVNSTTNVTGTAALDAAIAPSNPVVSTGQTFALTVGVDSVTGTGGDDTINANPGASNAITFTALDAIDGGAGTDTLNVNEIGAAGAAAYTLNASGTVKNVEVLNYVISSDNVGDTLTADVSAWTGLQTANFVVSGTDAPATITTKGNVTTVTINGTVAAGITDSATTDTLTTVTATDATGLVTVTSDKLTTLNLNSSSAGATVSAAAGTRVLSLNLNKLTGGTLTDAEATGVKIAATGSNSTGVTLTTVKATTLEFSGDKTVSLDLGAAGNQAANLTITSTNTAGVTLTGNALDTDVTFTGGDGKDTVTVGATTKAIAMGAGEDTVVVTGALGSGGSLNGGDGTDTLSMTAAVAQTLSADTTFSKAFSNFEKVSIGAPAAVTSNTVNLANLNNLSYVVSAGTGAAGTNETAAIQFTTLAAGASITIAGRTVTATSGNATATQVATAFSSGTSAGPLTVSGTLASYTAGAVSGGGNDTVTFTSTTQGDVANLAPTFAGVAAPAAPSVSTTNGVAATSTETADVTFSDLAIGQSVTVAGRVITATGGAATAAQVAAVASSGTSAGNLTASGTLADWTAGAAAGAVVTFTSTTANTNVTNITVSANGTATPTVTANTITAGTSGSTLTVSNMANAGTFELTGVVAGEATVSMKDATGSADSLNIKLNGTANVVNTGTLTVSGVETINIEATDSSADTTTLTNPAAASTINLVASAATKIVVTGNHGVNFTGSTLTNVVSLDATGVVSVGNAAGASSTQIGTTGAVTFTSAVTNQNVTVSTGNGADVINVSSVTDATKTTTVSTGAGNDTVTGSAGKDAINLGAGNDTVNSSGAVDTITLGDGNDIYVLGNVAHSVVAARDVITDFKANTVGQGAAGAVTTAGATTTAADRNGDVINIDAVNAAFTVIRVGVLGNAADAQTFIQNGAGASEGANTVNAALDSTTGYLYLDIDDNGVVDSVLELTGVTTINAAAFVLA